MDVPAGTTVKDLVESLGVPHTEVDVILVDGESVGFSHQLCDGDRVSVHPASDAPDLAHLVHLRPVPPGRPCFVLDVHLGSLARRLRLLGFDAVWSNSAPDEQLAALSAAEGRVLLTRDRGLLKRRSVTYGHLVRATTGQAQAVEVLRRFDLFDAVDPFSRCLECNGSLGRADKADIDCELLPRTRRDYQEFRRCSDCGRVYWAGSHFDRLRAAVDDILRHRGDGDGGPR